MGQRLLMLLILLMLLRLQNPQQGFQHLWILKRLWLL
jgi:hypothetical protein